VARVEIKKSVLKSILNMPKKEQALFKKLIDDLKNYGPVQPKWPNYSKLGKEEFHCHLSYSWVACWRTEKGNITIEVYYAGSRENAPY